MEKSARDLFTVRPGFKLVGADYAGLELRMLAHYMAKFDGGKFAKEVVEGDIHTTNSNLLGISRDESKRFIYATIYSAGPAKLGEIVGGGVKEGAALRARFYFSNIQHIKHCLIKFRRPLRGVIY